MYEAAVAHFLATGKRTLLDVAIKNADLLVKTFGPEPGQLITVPGHEEIEIGLVKLYRATGEEKYLRLAKFFIDMRGRSDKRKVFGEYCQDHIPLVEQTEVTGHAVRAGYLYSGVADVAALTGDADYIRAIDRLWEDMVSRQMYLTGSVGVFDHGEGYSQPYDLPNLKAYNETCAAIANALWNHRMFLLHGDAKYIDVLERIIYNGFLSGISLSGDQFFYPNPLACDGRFRFNHGDLVRSPWFGCSCCPVNVVRFIPSIAGYVYAQRGDEVFVNLYVAGSGTIQRKAGKLRLEQQTRYPWDGKVKIVVQPEPAGPFALKLRIPGWAQGRPVPSDLYRYAGQPTDPIRLTVNGQPAELTLQDGYATLRRQWQPGDVVELDLPMPVRRVLAHENVADDRGRVAVERGPIVYCVEGADHGGRVLNLVLPDDAQLAPEHRAGLAGRRDCVTWRSLGGAPQRGRRGADQAGADHDDPLLRLVPSRSERDGRLAAASRRTGARPAPADARVEQPRFIELLLAAGFRHRRERPGGAGQLERPFDPPAHLVGPQGHRRMAPVRFREADQGVSGRSLLVRRHRPRRLPRARIVAAAVPGRRAMEARGHAGQLGRGQGPLQFRELRPGDHQRLAD